MVILDILRNLILRQTSAFARGSFLFESRLRKMSIKQEGRFGRLFRHFFCIYKSANAVLFKKISSPFLTSERRGQGVLF
jgi:hypothetical protein